MWLVGKTYKKVMTKSVSSRIISSEGAEYQSEIFLVEFLLKFFTFLVLGFRQTLGMQFINYAENAILWTTVFPLSLMMSFGLE